MHTAMTFRIVADVVIGAVLVIGGKNLALGIVDESAFAMSFGAGVVFVGIMLWISAYGKVRRHRWNVLVRTLCYLFLAVLFTLAIAGAILTHRVKSYQELVVGLLLWAVMTGNLLLSFAELRNQRSQEG